jgi:hypothetical protein
MRSLVGVAVALFFAGIAAPAQAQAEAAPETAVAPAPAAAAAPAPARRISLFAPAPGPPAQRRYHVHDGFYLRMSLGVGVLSASVDQDAADLADFSAGGGALALDVLVGGSPSPGLAVGGALLLHRGSSGDVDIDGEQVNATTQLGLGLLGAFVDGFPDPDGGFHFGGALGLAGVSVDIGEGEPGEHNGGGLGGAAWVGWAVWVAPEWSMGADLRFAGAITRDENGGATQDARSGSITVLFSTLYH